MGSGLLMRPPTADNGAAKTLDNQELVPHHHLGRRATIGRAGTKRVNADSEETLPVRYLGTIVTPPTPPPPLPTYDRGDAATFDHTDSHHK